jgi:spore coat polysaccharide biosynthesis protein SpsF
MESRENSMTFYGFITVRVDSTRLPEKALLPLGEKRLIDHVIERAKSIKGLDGVVVCTSDRPQDDVIEAIANEHKVLCYRGSLNDKLERWRGAAERFSADYIITLDGDDPFCDPALVEAAIAQLQEKKPDFMEAPENLAIGGFTYALSRTALEKVCEIKDTEDTEMMWTYFTDTNLFSCTVLDVKNPVVLTPFRLTLDYPEDLEFFSKVFKELSITTNTVPLHDIMLFLKERPDIVALNAFRHEQWLANQKAKTKLKLKKQ